MNTNTTKLLGLRILSAVNLYFFGIFLLVASLIMLWGMAKPQNLAAYNDAIQQHFGNSVSIDAKGIKIAFLLQALVSLVFIISGFGLSRVKEWARKLTLVFSAAIVIITFVFAIRNTALLGQAILQIIYPGILILYLTNRNVEAHFRNK